MIENYQIISIFFKKRKKKIQREKIKNNFPSAAEKQMVKLVMRTKLSCTIERWSGSHIFELFPAFLVLPAYVD